jgi:hypothetical protein
VVTVPALSISAIRARAGRLFGWPSVLSATSAALPSTTMISSVLVPGALSLGSVGRARTSVSRFPSALTSWSSLSHDRRSRVPVALAATSWAQLTIR